MLTNIFVLPHADGGGLDIMLKLKFYNFLNKDESHHKKTLYTSKMFLNKQKWHKSLHTSNYNC